MSVRNYVTYGIYLRQMLPDGSQVRWFGEARTMQNFPVPAEGTHMGEAHVISVDCIHFMGPNDTGDPQYRVLLSDLSSNPALYDDPDIPEEEKPISHFLGVQLLMPWLIWSWRKTTLGTDAEDPEDASKDFSEVMFVGKAKEVFSIPPVSNKDFDAEMAFYTARQQKAQPDGACLN